MIIPIRCVTCGNVIASKYRSYQHRRDKHRSRLRQTETSIISSNNIHGTQIQQTPEKLALDELGLDRYCCRRHFISQVDIIHFL